MAGEKDKDTESTLPPEFVEAVNRAAEREQVETPAAPVVTDTNTQEPESTADVVETPKAETPATPDPEQEQPAADAKSGDGEAAPTISPELAEMARRYGLSDEDVAEFTPDELKRATKLLDREAAKLLKAQGPGPATARPTPPAEGTPEAKATEPPKTEPQPEATAPTIEQQIQALRDKGWDEDILALHKASLEKTAALEKQFAHVDGYLRQRSQAEMQMHQQHQQRAQQARVGVVLQGIDSLNRSDLFGTPDKAPTEEQTRNLTAMRESIDALQVLQHRRGLDPTLTSELVGRAYEIAFSKQLQHEAAKNKASAVIKQSKAVMGQGRKANVPAKSIPVDESDVASHPRIKEFFAAIKAESA